MDNTVLSGLDSLIQTGNTINDKKQKSIKDNMEELSILLETEIIQSDTDEEQKKDMLKKLRKFCNTQTNIMLVGATGCGKSSTINALFSAAAAQKSITVAKVGSRSDPETEDIEKYTIGNLILWDTPGLGDGSEIDLHHKQMIQDLLRETDADGNALIDLVLLILDGSTRDLGTSYQILHEIILPELGSDAGRIIVALNQADIALKTGRHWNYETNEPDSILIQFLKEKVDSIHKRIKEDSGIDASPVYYCAGYQEESGDIVRPYNLSKLLYTILNAIPSHKRIAVMESVNSATENYEHNDDEMNYGKAIKDSFMELFDPIISEKVERGAEIGSTILGIPGAIVGAFLGGAIGCIESILDDIF